MRRAPRQATTTPTVEWVAMLCRYPRSRQLEILAEAADYAREDPRRQARSRELVAAGRALRQLGEDVERALGGDVSHPAGVPASLRGGDITTTPNSHDPQGDDST